MLLSSAHSAALKDAAICPEIAAERGYRTVETRGDLRRLGFKDAQCLVPTLLVPVWAATDREQPSLYQHRPDTPRILQGKAVKYETPAGSRMVIDVHPSLRVDIRDPNIPILITEGCKKADAAISAGLCCVALLGVWGWKGTNEHGGNTVLPDLDEIAWRDRQAFIAFDSDVMKPAVHQAMEGLSNALKRRGAIPQFIYLPPGPNGEKVGMDDYLAAGHTADELLALASPTLLVAPNEAREAGIPYRETERGLVWLRPTREGEDVPTPLTTFTARIVGDLLTDDGAETLHEYRIEGHCGSRTNTFTIPLSAFDALAWPAEHLGSRACTYPAGFVREHTRLAIRQLSGEVPEERVYTHIGWKEVEPGTWAYLHAGGAIGTEVGVQVRVGGILSRYLLPEPPQEEALKAAIWAALRCLEVGPKEITFPLLAGVFRAAMGGSDFALALAGKTGVFKSELSSLMQRFYGQGMDARHLPGSWSSTENALEEVAFLAKDALLVVDDFLPKGSSQEVQRLHAKADRVLRAQGNGSGRQRMKVDGTLRLPRPPRGLILSTGEDVPAGQSLQARMLLLEVRPGDIPSEALSQCQRDAASGEYAACMAGFLRWMAPHYGHIRRQLPVDAETVRERVLVSGHRRTPGIVAELYCGLECFLCFGLETGAITQEEKESLMVQGWEALIAAGKQQVTFHQSSEPTTRFLELLRQAISSGSAHVASATDRQDGRPENPERWGWRLRAGGLHGGWEPQGERIGYTDGEKLYLLPDAAFAIARHLGDEAGDGLTMTPTTLWKRLNEAGLLLRAGNRETLKVRRHLGGELQNVLCLSVAALNGDPSDTIEMEG